MIITRTRLLALLLFALTAWFGGCANPAESRAQRSGPAVAMLPETYEGHAETPSSFVAKPIMLGSRAPSPGHSRVVREPMLAEAVFEYVVDEQGAVIAFRIIETNHAAFAETVRAWISSARFVPGVMAGEKVKVRVRDRMFVEVARSRTPVR